MSYTYHFSYTSYCSITKTNHPQPTQVCNSREELIGITTIKFDNLYKGSNIWVEVRNTETDTKDIDKTTILEREFNESIYMTYKKNMDYTYDETRFHEYTNNDGV